MFVLCLRLSRGDLDITVDLDAGMSTQEACERLAWRLQKMGYESDAFDEICPTVNITYCSLCRRGHVSRDAAPKMMWNYFRGFYFHTCEITFAKNVSPNSEKKNPQKRGKSMWNRESGPNFTWNTAEFAISCETRAHCHVSRGLNVHIIGFNSVKHILWKLVSHLWN